MSSTRKRTKPVSYVFGDSDQDPESDYEPILNSKKPTKRKKTQHRSQRRRSASASGSEYESTNQATNCERDAPESATTHPVSRHTIKNTDDIRRNLLVWYSRVHEDRGMPWRKPFEPSLDAQGRSQRAYEVWISEIMLQQTQVATVIPYYTRWMEKLPTIHDLANSDIETVNALWKGLGYYSRAARLLSGAQKIVKEYGGLFPDNAKDMIANVPGIGRYSAGAISSIAYNHCEPVLDGNVNRLLSRVLALHANPKNKATLDVLWDGSTALVKGATEPGNINQALIELGATICKSQNPACSSCPISNFCAAHRETQGLPLDEISAEADIEELCSLCEPVQPHEGVGVTRYPIKVSRKKAREEIDVVNVVEWLSPSGRRYFLLVRRPEKGLLAGLHEFPAQTNVQGDFSSGSSPERLQKIGQDVLHSLLVHPPPPYHPPDPKSLSLDRDRQVKGGGGGEIGRYGGGLRISKMKLAGDVLHVFSHIRKTYRVQWVLLEGTSVSASPNPDLDSDIEKPPALRTDYAADAAEAVSKKNQRKEIVKTKTTKTKIKKINAEVEEIEQVEVVEDIEETTKSTKASPNLRWVDYEDVQHANIGTGVMKVWKKVNELWANAAATEGFFKKRNRTHQDQ